MCEREGAVWARMSMPSDDRSVRTFALVGPFKILEIIPNCWSEIVKIK
jgi:hypothetical protein